MACRTLNLYLLLVSLWLTACGAADAPAAGQPGSYLTTIPDPKTLGETYVSDPDRILQATTVADLNATLQALDKAGRAHIDVVLVNSIGDAVPKTAAYELFNRWKIGSKAKDNGLLMLLVLDQRRMEFETGYGLEADLPDILCYRIQQRYMVPLVRARRYDETVQAGVAAIIRQLTQQPDSLMEAAPEQTDGSLSEPEPGQSLAASGRDEPANPSKLNSGLAILGGIIGMGLYIALAILTTVAGRWHRWLLGLSVLLPASLIARTAFASAPALGLVLLVAYLLPLLYLHGYLVVVGYRAANGAAYPSRHTQHEYLSETHYRLGFSAYTFPVLLAFYWPWHRRRLRQLREVPYRCLGCGCLMHQLSEQEDNEHLALGQVAEEMMKSIDYDVWQCGHCQQQLIFGYRNLASTAMPCPECQHHTYLEKNRQVVKAARTSSEGWGWQHYQCEFCSYRHKEKFTIAQISTSSSSSSSSDSDSGGSSSGGSSGGGGAGSSW